MAEILLAGEFATEGERRTAEALRGLPEHWVVLCNKTLVTQNGRSFEIDFIVLGDHAVYVIDEKSWRGRIHGSDQHWVREDGSSERSPLSKIDYVAKVLAGELRARVNRLGEIGDAHFVFGRVLLSAATEPPRINDARKADGVLLLDSAVEQLVAFDQRPELPDLTPHRDAIRTVLHDLRARPKFPTAIGDYSIEEILSTRPGAYQARAVHRLAGPRTLWVYHLPDPHSDLREAYTRAYQAIARLSDTGLVPVVGDPFGWSEEFLVIPFAPPPGKALAALKPPGSADDCRAELSLAARAFEGLATLHQRGVIHRALQPDALYVEGSVREPKRLTFTNFHAAFHAARLEGHATIAPKLGELAAVDPYAAPELAVDYGLAEPVSDVYSLALVFLERLTGLSVEELRASNELAVRCQQLAARWPQLPPSVIDALAQLFTQALGRGPSAPPDAEDAQRPSAAACAERLRDIVRRWQLSEVEGGRERLDDRYRVRRKLGEGAFGRTYLVEDEQLGPEEPRVFVVKVFHRPEAALEQARGEFARLRSLQTRYVPRVYDFYPPHCDVHLKMDYVPGPTLAEVRGEFPWPEARWWRFAEELLKALQVLEEHGLRHRDLKPSNIILHERDGHPVLIDFGLAVPSQRPAPPAGTPDYLPPEAYHAPTPPDSIDRYAAAIILHEALTGVRPADPLPAPLDERRERLREVLLAAASPRPAERPASAADFLQRLRQARAVPSGLASELHLSTTPGTVRQTNPWVVAVRGLYRGSASGNAENRGLDTAFARETYVPTALDERLLPAILDQRPPAVFLTGNPGDGKTAFLERVREQLAARGAVCRQQDASGWEWEWDGHVFRACYDASEAHDGLSADEQLARRLAGLDGDAPPSERALTVLVAINDGRLADFFDRHEARFPWLALRVRHAVRGSTLHPEKPWVIDLKPRAFISLAPGPGRPSVFQRVLDVLVAPEHWAACAPCSARAMCPLWANAEALRGEHDGRAARARLEYLIALAHLRREFHPTMRDLRSTLAYLITANLTCDDIHRAREGTAQPEHLGAASRWWQRVFQPPADADPLLASLALLDPGRVPRPRLERALALAFTGDYRAALAPLFPDAQAAASELDPALYDNLDRWLAAVKRRLYGHGDAAALERDGLSAKRLLPYRHADRFLAALRGEADLTALRSDLTRGITRSEGLFAEVLGDSLCVRVHYDASQQLAVLKQFAAEEFRLEVVRPAGGSAVETIPEALQLVYHDRTATLTIGLDLFELLLRFAEGMLPGAPEHQPLLEDLVPFKNRLVLASTPDLVLLDADRQPHRLTQRNGKIARLAAEG